jgi:hypothetical protein
VKKLVLASVAIAALLAISSPAAGQGYPAAPCTFTSSGSLTTPGETVLVEGTCAPAGASVSIVFSPPGTTVLTTSADNQGAFSGSFVVPRRATPGLHTLTARVGAKVLGTTRMNVLSPLSSPGGKKGTSPLAVAGGAAAALLLLGGVVFLLKRA